MKKFPHVNCEKYSENQVRKLTLRCPFTHGAHNTWCVSMLDAFSPTWFRACWILDTMQKLCCKYRSAFYAAKRRRGYRLWVYWYVIAQIRYFNKRVDSNIQANKKEYRKKKLLQPQMKILPASPIVPVAWEKHHQLAYSLTATMTCSIFTHGINQMFYRLCVREPAG